MTAKEIAQQLKARVVYPTDPKRHIDLFRTNVKETWDRARAEAAPRQQQCRRVK